MVGLGDPGHVKAHVGWRTHDGRIPARRIKLSVLCYSGTGTYTLIKEAEGSKREQTRREAGGTRNEIRQCSRAKPAEGRGMTEPCDMGQVRRYVDLVPWGLTVVGLGSYSQLAANPGGGAQGRYEGYMTPLPLPPAPLSPCPSHVPSPEVHRRHPARPRTVGLPSRKVPREVF